MEKHFFSFLKKIEIIVKEYCGVFKKTKVVERRFFVVFLGIFALIIIIRFIKKVDNYSLAFCLRGYLFEHIIKSGLKTKNNKKRIKKKFRSADYYFSKRVCGNNFVVGYGLIYSSPRDVQNRLYGK